MIHRSLPIDKMEVDIGVKRRIPQVLFDLGHPYVRLIHAVPEHSRKEGGGEGSTASRVCARK